MLNLDDPKNFPTMPQTTWYSRKHILGFCDIKLDYSADVETHKIFEYVYFHISFNNDHEALIVDDEGNKYSSIQAFNEYIMQRFPGYLENGQCYASIAYQYTELGIKNT